MTAPRIFFGAISDMYLTSMASVFDHPPDDADERYTDKMTMAEMKPTPAPQMMRPTTMTAMPVDAVSRMQPTVKTTQPAMMVVRRPTKSATSPATIAPKKVPQLRIDVVSDCSQLGTTKTLEA